MSHNRDQKSMDDARAMWAQHQYDKLNDDGRRFIDEIVAALPDRVKANAIYATATVRFPEAKAWEIRALGDIALARAGLR